MEANYAVVKAYQYTTLTSIQVTVISQILILNLHFRICHLLHARINCSCYTLTKVESDLQAFVKLSSFNTILYCIIVFQLLDCFVIPVLMILSWFFLKTRYSIIHFVSVCICLAGVGAMVGADILAGQDQGSSKKVLI